MSREQNSNVNGKKAQAKAFRVISWQYLMACPCSGRQIRHHLLIADLLVWLAIILAIIFISTRL